MSRASAGGLRSVVAATAEKLCFTHCFGQTFLLFQPVARRLPSFRGRGTMAPLLARRSKGENRGEVGSVALQHLAAACPIDSHVLAF